MELRVRTSELKRRLLIASKALCAQPSDAASQAWVIRFAEELASRTDVRAPTTGWCARDSLDGCRLHGRWALVTSTGNSSFIGQFERAFERAASRIDGAVGRTGPLQRVWSGVSATLGRGGVCGYEELDARRGTWERVVTFASLESSVTGFRVVASGSALSPTQLAFSPRALKLSRRIGRELSIPLPPSPKSLGRALRGAVGRRGEARLPASAEVVTVRYLDDDLRVQQNDAGDYFVFERQQQPDDAAGQRSRAEEEAVARAATRAAYGRGKRGGEGSWVGVPDGFVPGKLY